MAGLGLGRAVTKGHKGKVGLIGGALAAIPSYLVGKKLGDRQEKTLQGRKNIEAAHKVMNKKYGKNKWGENQFYNQKDY